MSKLTETSTRLINQAIDKLIEFAKRTPYFHLEGYMERYWLIPYGKIGIAARIHHILRSDDNRAFHDHPWPYLTVILRGGYTEIRPIFESGVYIGEHRQWHGAGSILFRRADSWHRLEIPEGHSAWTLFITGPKVRRWGFLIHPEHKVYWRDYLG
jgi:hypothetical protein